jgi:hypothetical protein
VAAIYSLRGTLRERPPTTLRPPFRAPHHSISPEQVSWEAGPGSRSPGRLVSRTRAYNFITRGKIEPQPTGDLLSREPNESWLSAMEFEIE